MANGCKADNERFICPCCDEEIMEANLPYCQACGINVLYCPKCQKPFHRENKVCPHCGAEIRAEVKGKK